MIIPNQKTKTQQIVLMAALIAINVILSRFLSISAWNFKISFSFVPVVIAALYLGTWQAGIVGGIGDFIGAMLFPIAQYFPGFTLVALLTGVSYGFFLHKKQTFPRILCVVIFVELIGSVLLNSLWISLLHGTPYWAILPPRLVQASVMIVVKCIVIRFIANYMPTFQKNTAS